MSDRKEFEIACREASPEASARIARAKRVTLVGRAAAAARGLMALRLANQTLTFREEDVVDVSKRPAGGFRVTLNADAVIDVSTSYTRRAVTSERCNCRTTNGVVAYQGRQPGSGGRTLNEQCSKEAWEAMTDPENENLSADELDKVYEDTYDSCVAFWDFIKDLSIVDPGVVNPISPPPPPTTGPGGIIYWYPKAVRFRQR